ncbi:MAG: hypothetical protein LBE18_02300 [Planctomycetaceae bacterium]|nr:hypothetical protein [Planctomycetaceae bacterium]
MKRAIRRQLRIWYTDISSYLSKLKTFHRTALGIILAIVIIYAARVYLFDPLRAEIAELESAYNSSEPPNPLPTIESDEEITLAKEQIIHREKSTETKKLEMETVAKSRNKITQQNKESVLSDFASIISKNKLTVVLGGAPDTNNSTSDSTKSTPRKPAAAAAAKPPAEPKKNTTATKPKSNSNSKSTAKNTKSTAKKTETETKTTPQNIEQPLKTEEYVYHLEGDFSNLFDFMKQIESFPYPIKITKLYFGSSDTLGDISPLNTKHEQLQLKFHLILYFH